MGVRQPLLWLLLLSMATAVLALSLPPPQFPDFTDVRVRSDIIDVFAVNDHKPSMEAHIRFQFIWTDERLSDVPNKGADPIEWTPELDFPNLVESYRRPSFEVSQKFTFNNETKQVTEIVVIRGNWAQDFDFTDFPFDTQKFEVAIRSFSDKVIFRSLDDDLDIPSDDFSLQTFDMRDDADIHIDNENRIVFGAEVFDSTYVLSFKGDREWHAVVVEHVIPGMFAVLVSQAQLYVDMRYFGSRVSISVFSLVFLANLQSYTGTVIPSSDSFTYLEAFALMNYILMFLSVVEVTWGQYLEVRHFKNGRRMLDYNSRFAFPGAFVVINVALLIYYAGDSTLGTILWSCFAGVLWFIILGAMIVATSARLIYRRQKEKGKAEAEE